MGKQNIINMFFQYTANNSIQRMHTSVKSSKNSIGVARTPQPGEKKFDTLRYRRSRKRSQGVQSKKSQLYQDPNNVYVEKIKILRERKCMFKREKMYVKI